MNKRKKFIWTDELVKQYGQHLFAFGISEDEKIKRFKQYINNNFNIILTF